MELGQTPVVIRKGKRAAAAYEYFCYACGQLRLSLVEADTCGLCGSSNILKGKPGELDKEKLKADYAKGILK